MREKIDLFIHYKHLLNFLEKLKELDEELLRKPILPTKWSCIEIIGHFIKWDELILYERLPFIGSKHPLLTAPSTEQTNETSAKLARERSVNVTINEAIATRKQLLLKINELSFHAWEKTIIIEGEVIAFSKYIQKFVEHDLHHMEQIRTFLKKWDLHI